MFESLLTNRQGMMIIKKMIAIKRSPPLPAGLFLAIAYQSTINKNHKKKKRPAAPTIFNAKPDTSFLIPDLKSV